MGNLEQYQKNMSIQNIEYIARIYSEKADNKLNKNWLSYFERNKRKQDYLVEIAKRNYTNGTYCSIIDWLIADRPISQIEMVLDIVEEFNLGTWDYIHKILCGSKKFTNKQLKFLLNQRQSLDKMKFVYACIEQEKTLNEIKRYLQYNLSYHKLEIIRYGFESGLTDDQIAIYAKNKYSAEIMEMIRQAILNKWSDEQIKLISNTKFSDDCLKQIFLGFENGLSIEQVMVYVNEKFSDSQMYCIRLGLQEGLPMKKVLLYAKPKYTSAQMYCIIKGLEELPVASVKVYLNPKFSEEKMSLIHSMLMLNFTYEDLKPYLHLDDQCMRWVFYLLKEGCSQERINIILSTEYNEKQKEIIMKGYKLGYNDDYIALYLNPKFDVNQMNEILEGLIQLSINKVQLYANPEFDCSKMKLIREQLMERKISFELAKAYIKPGFSQGQMCCIYNALIKHGEKFVPYINSKYSEFTIDYISKALLQDFTESEIDELLQADKQEDKFYEILSSKHVDSSEYKERRIKQTLLKKLSEV